MVQFTSTKFIATLTGGGTPPESTRSELKRVVVVMAERKRKRRSADPDAIYLSEDAEVELPWIASHLSGEPTPWDFEFAF